MKYDKHTAPDGYLYFKDGVGGKVVITPSGSDVIETYELVKIENKGDEKE